MKQAIFFFTFIQFSFLLFAQNSFENGLKSIKKEVIQAELEFLSSDYLEGREMGQKGGYVAAEYIASLMKLYGLQPLYNDYFQEFNVIELKQNGNNEFRIKQKTKNGEIVLSFQDKVDFSIDIIDLSRNLEAQVVFAGYGITDNTLGYDDYKGLDVNGKFVFILDGFPGHTDKNSDAYKTFNQKYTIRRYADNYSKAENAKTHGAIGIIKLVADYEKNTWNSNKHYFDEEMLKKGQFPGNSFYDKEYILHEEQMTEELLEIKVTKRLAKSILGKKDFDFETFENQVKQNQKPQSFNVAEIFVEVKTNIASSLVKCRNVCGIIKGKDTTTNIIVGAHYDHYGMYNNFIWNGADDNGSGTTGMLTLAKAFSEMSEQPEHNLIFVAFDGEEKGLHGSTFFASEMPADMKVDYMLNFDMISRNSREDSLGNICYIILANYNENIQPVLEKSVSENDLNLNLTYWPSDGKGGGSDHAPFARKGIPYSFFWSGWHDDYHNPSDEIQKINWDKMLNLCKLGFIHVYEIDRNGL